MTDLDEQIVRTLRERAEGTVDTDRLTARAVAGGKTRRRRRRVGAGVTVGLVAVLGFTVATGTGLLQRVRPPGSAAPAAATAAPPRLDGIQGAAARPDLVGTDPRVLHFGMDPARVRHLRWGVGSGVESVQVDVGAGPAVSVQLSASAAGLRRGVDGPQGQDAGLSVEDAFDGTDRPHREAGRTTTTWIRLWQPVPGLYARAAVTATTARGIDDAVGALRLDEARRCATPARLTTLPTGARVSGCTVDVAAFPEAVTASLQVEGTGGKQMKIAFQYAHSIEAGRTIGNRTIGGRSAYLYPQGGQLELLGIPKAHLIANFGWPYEGFTEADAAVVLGGAQVAADPADPQSWG
ncbi:hypothetical protein [Micromonospora sp. NPDC023644]|uniref:hypothetical protein n=1 Tax=Micromonospora sp. NPDC023644 TaxID=3154321 RepID=UPI0033CFEA35